ncbi:MAG: DUF86 domain-containing protein [bacterium]|nr:DUF86 domain-containing protein [bacterium]
MSKRGDKEFLLDIKEAIERIRDYTTGLSYQAFLQDIKTQDAVVRNIEIIGEAVKNLSRGLKEKYKDIEWKDIAGMRDKIIHVYFGIRWELVWSVVNEKIPELRLKIDKIIQHMRKNDLYSRL